MIKIILFFCAINLLANGWPLTGLLLLYVVVLEEFK